MITAQGTTEPATEPLSVFRAILEGYRATARGFASFILLAVVWTTLATATEYLIEKATHASSDLRAHYGFAAVMRAGAAALVQYAELLVAASLIAIAIYRAIILDERRSWTVTMRIGRREIRLLGLVVLFSVPANLGVASIVVAVNLGIAPLILMQALAAIGIPLLRLVAVILLAHLLVSVMLTPFLGLAFPLIAIDAPRSALRQSLRLSRDHRLRLAAIGFLAPLPVMPLIYAPYFVGVSDTAMVVVLQSAAGSFFGLLAEALVTGVFAVAFQRVTGHLNKGTYGVFD